MAFKSNFEAFPNAHSSLKIPGRSLGVLGESTDLNHVYRPNSLPEQAGLSLKLVKADFAHKKEKAYEELNAY